MESDYTAAITGLIVVGLALTAMVGFVLTRPRFNVRATWTMQSERKLAQITGLSIGPGTFTYAPARRLLDFNAEYQLTRRLALFAYGGAGPIHAYGVARILGVTELGYYGMANRLISYPLATTAQTYRFVLLPMAFRIVIPPLTSESMNIVKNSAVAFAVSIPELAQFAQQASEETSHFEEIFIPVTLLYFVSAFAINRIAKFIEARVRIPGPARRGRPVGRPRRRLR